jgi:hypothetical protein
MASPGVALLLLMRAKQLPLRSPDRLREVIAATGRSRRELARVLGYRSENSLRQAGKRTISDAEVKWLERYARFRSRLATMEAAWLEKNPPPARRRGE